MTKSIKKLWRGRMSAGFSVFGPGRSRWRDLAGGDGGPHNRTWGRLHGRYEPMRQCLVYLRRFRRFDKARILEMAAARYTTVQVYEVERRELPGGPQFLYDPRVERRVYADGTRGEWRRYRKER